MSYLSTFTFILFFVLFISCGDSDVEMDFINASILLEVQDNQGEDLLDPDNGHNLLDNDLKIVYRDKEYRLNADLRYPDAQTRYNLPLWDGFHTCELNGKRYLAFGEFSPTDNYRGETFTIDWGDGSTTQITFDYYVKRKGDKVQDVVLSVLLNGESVGQEEIVSGHRYGKILIVK